MSASTITVADALGDPLLLGAALGPTDTWAAWLSVLKAAFGIKLGRAERRAFASVPGAASHRRRRCKSCGRLPVAAAGKSRIRRHRRLSRLLPRARPRPGETGYVLVLAGSRDQARHGLLTTPLAFLRRSPILRKLIKNVTAHEIN